jgi:TM2 domain-containing membrane protein YozV
MSSEKSKVTALLLCFFVGMLGIHRFYVGKETTGILYIFTLGWLGIGVLVDFIMILSNKFKDENGCVLDIWKPTI